DEARSLATDLHEVADTTDPEGAKPKAAVVNIQVRQSFKEPHRIARAIREALRGTFEAGTINNVVVEPESPKLSPGHFGPRGQESAKAALVESAFTRDERKALAEETKAA